MSAFAGTVRVSQVADSARASTTFWSKGFEWLHSWWSQMHAGRQIGALSDRQLRDIGMTRPQTDQHATHAFRPLIQNGQQDQTLLAPVRPGQPADNL